MIPLEASAATARAALKEMQLVLVDYTATAAALELRHRASCWPPVYAPPAQRDKGIVDMSYWRDLEQHARLQLGIPPAIGAIHVKIYLESTFCGLAGDETALVAAVGQLCRLGAERLRAAPYIVGHVLSVLVPPRVLPPLNVGAPPMSNEQRNELARELLHACYAAGRQKWTSECDARVSSCPAAVYQFLRLRELVAVAQGGGDGFLLLNPVACVCPFHGGSCTGDGLVRLNTLNQISHLIQHLRAVHAPHNPTARTLLARLEHVLQNDKAASVATLDQLHPWPEGAALGGDQWRELDCSRADLWLPTPPSCTHPLALMLNELLSPRVGVPTLTREHVQVQALDSLVHALLDMHIADWQTEWPALSHWAMALHHVGRERTYRLLRGSGLFGSGASSKVSYPIVSASVPSSETQVRMRPARWVDGTLMVSVCVVNRCASTSALIGNGCSRRAWARSSSLGGCRACACASLHRSRRRLQTHRSPCCSKLSVVVMPRSCLVETT
jgi:hypothetical protein